MLKRFLPILIVFALIVSNLPMIARAQETPSNDTIQNVDPEFNATSKVGEITSERTANSSTFYLGNGKFQKRIYQTKIHNKNKKTGKWEDISPNLEDKDSSVVTTDNTSLVPSFLKQMDNGKYVTYQYGDQTISFSLVKSTDTDGKDYSPNDVKAEFSNNENQILYKDVFPSINLRDFTFDSQIKEDLILNQYTGVNQFEYKIETSLKALTKEDGSIDFVDHNDKEVFTLPKPYMEDSNIDVHKGEGQQSDKVKYSLKPIDGGYQLVIIADSDWLKSSDRVYPVYIDPSTSINASSDTFVMSAYPTANYSSSSDKWDSTNNAYVLKIGNYDSTTGTCYGYLNESLSSIANMNIDSATFNVHVIHSYYPTTATGLWLNYNTASWSPSTLTWNSRPTSTNITSVDVAKNQWAKFDVTSIVKAWLDGTKPNYGFNLNTNGNGQTFWKKVVSSTNSTLKPYLSVNYTIPVPTNITGKGYSNGDGTGYVNLSWDKVDGAKSYNVWIYNGIAYEHFNVGNVTSWSTHNNYVWPTQTEINAGRYTLHHSEISTSDKGTELPIDPKPVYINSGGTHTTSNLYYFKVNAVFDQGESASSANTYTTVIPNLAKPNIPTGISYSNGDGTGYVDFNWKSVPGATGYKIWLFNGDHYEGKDVGNVTSWTTKGKKYWPTATEIAAKKFNLHLDDNKGAELSVDPSKVYANAGTKYATTTKYYFRVSAYNSQGETVNSDAYMPTIPDLKVPPAPNGFSYTNMPSTNSGYIKLSWDPIPGATGYKVWMFNGKDYESFDAKDTTSWTTQNLGIWPTQAEIDKGAFLLHHDNKGTEIPIDPSPVYKNSGGNYATSQYYYFRVSAYNLIGETIYSPTYFRTTIGKPEEFLGKEDYWSIFDIPNGSVNAATGNLIINQNDFSISGLGPDLGISRTYNSLSSTGGIFGLGWHSDAEMRVVADPDGKHVNYTDDDGTLHVFTKNADSYSAPTGVYLQLEKTTDSYKLTNTDQTQFYFDVNSGNLTKKVDGYGNTTSYQYPNQKLLSITDASGRVLSINYNSDGRVQSITFKNKTVSYEYNNGLLTKVTQTDGSVTKYSYNSNFKLEKVYEPNDTADNPVIDQYSYDTNGRIKTATDPNNHQYQLSYDDSKNHVLFIQPNGHKTQYTYNEAANPIQMIVDPDNLKITTNYVYEGNNLIKSYDPNDQGKSNPTESYQYDNNGNVTKALDSYGTETYQYNKNNDITLSTDTEGNNTSIAYNGLNPVSETDQADKTSSVSKFDKHGKLTETSDSLASGTNLIINRDLSSWVKLTNNDSGTIGQETTKDKADVISGPIAIKLDSQSTTSDNSQGYVSGTQDIKIEPNKTYTFSSKIKTALTKANAFLNVRLLDSKGNHIIWVNNRYSKLSGTTPWTERQITFTTPDNAATARIYLEVEHNDPSASGQAWFNAIQLEQSDVSSSYNPIVNSSFENSLKNWSGSGGSIDAESFDGDHSLKLTGSAKYTQTIIINQDNNDTPVPFTLTGLSKAVGVSGTGTYTISANVHYTDGTTETKNPDSNYPIGDQDWNRAAVSIPASKPVQSIDVSVIFNGYLGTVWFDAIRLLEGTVTTKNSYDDYGNVTQQVDEAGNTTKKEYDPSNNLTSETDANGNKKSYEYDLANQLQKVTIANGTSISYAYDKNGNITSKVITDPNGIPQKYSYLFDPTGKVLQTTGPLNDVTKNEYDSSGKLFKTTLPNGNTVETSYDGADRIHSISFNGKESYLYGYDLNGNETNVKNVEIGEEKVRTYDNANRVTAITDRGGTQNWEYPANSDKLKSFSFGQGTFSQKNTYVYNQSDENTIVSDGSNTYQFDYDERGHIRTFTSGDRSGASYNYDDRGLLKDLSVGTVNGDSILFESYKYDANRNRISIHYPSKQDILYSYDALNELTKEVLKDGTTFDYTYDGFGNRTKIKKTTKDGQVSTIDASFNSENELRQFGDESIKYDENGNRTEDGKYVYLWNAKDQLVSVTKQGESTPFVTYSYDEDGKRIKKIVNGTIINYHYDGDSIRILYETDAQNNVVRSYTYSADGQLLSMKKGNKSYFYNFNSHGDVISITDSFGAIVATYEYDAWGNPTKVEESDVLKDNQFRYAGYQYDTETGLYYLIARYYQPQQGVFLSLDPSPGQNNDFITQNGYTYASNNPVMNVDPDGNFAAAVGVYFIPGVGEVAMAATVIVGGAYGAWYLGKKIKEVTQKK
ncbi:Wall-associated protein [Bacillus sp. MUM 116]|nr:Wall-associated protein [Bacillus sp. MUM 116]